MVWSALDFCGFRSFPFLVCERRKEKSVYLARHQRHRRRNKRIIPNNPIDIGYDGSLAMPPTPPPQFPIHNPSSQSNSHPPACWLDCVFYLRIPAGLCPGGAAIALAKASAAPGWRKWLESVLNWSRRRRRRSIACRLPSWANPQRRQTLYAKSSSFVVVLLLMLLLLLCTQWTEFWRLWVGGWMEGQKKGIEMVWRWSTRNKIKIIIKRCPVWGFKLDCR